MTPLQMYVFGLIALAFGGFGLSHIVEKWRNRA